MNTVELKTILTEAFMEELRRYPSLARLVAERLMEGRGEATVARIAKDAIKARGGKKFAEMFEDEIEYLELKISLVSPRREFIRRSGMYYTYTARLAAVFAYCVWAQYARRTNPTVFFPPEASLPTIALKALEGKKW